MLFFPFSTNAFSLALHFAAKWISFEASARFATHAWVFSLVKARWMSFQHIAKMFSGFFNAFEFGKRVQHGFSHERKTKLNIKEIYGLKLIKTRKKWVFEVFLILNVDLTKLPKSNLPLPSKSDVFFMVKKPTTFHTAVICVYTYMVIGMLKGEN